ncbi:corticotropin-releasing factor receptor 1 [Lepeophtheirus salmonis]|uniref:corticotropin-releasing factor receptor 1 n=1 Tax=Lepeophtheirus salmonis TaxID=72036 RepID=UPI001AE37CCA|nr:corticotropin-releasing factor receptor 1-like [Lepeophtheirus salmonis]
MSLLYLNGSFSLEEEHCSDGWSNNSLSTLSIEKNISTEESFCDRYWDNIACWPATKSGVTLAMPCNSFKAFMDLFLSTGRVQSDIKGFAYLKCNESGHWNNRTNYIECTNLLNDILSDEETRKHVRHAVSIITFSLCLTSMVFLLISLGIYSFFKSLQSDRLRVHKNFMSALMIRYVVSVVYYEPYIYGDPSPFVWFKVYGKGLLCKGILILLMFGYIAPVFWMFVEGMYLNSRITTNVFESKAPMKMFYLIGWCVPFLCVLTWAIAMSIAVDDESCVVPTPSKIPDSCNKTSLCWEGYNEMPYSTILSIPMTIALIVNLLFLINIVRIVVTRYRGIGGERRSDVRRNMAGGRYSSNSHGSSSIVVLPPSHQSDNVRIRKAVRATLILFPLLGITHLLFFINPRNGTHDKIYMLFNASLQSSQGILLSVLYCFTTTEVRDTIRRHFHRISTRNEMRRETIRRAENMQSNLWNNTTMNGPVSQSRINSFKNRQGVRESDGMIMQMVEMR